ncbi:helix-turn-helix transcriptional regulator [Amycolatopsis sp. DSM 110486]|uniref:helix-turn-helix transcriptional regulator n=1 Tax=Amycolatopsis sp. DSM 110486 TaxID=2865832 RepID=UPI001C694BFD|nr:helix-turn-helix transcriptional regulator [Amycolatopsis sp. DSM 110486]QYN18996.1 helix-turn-helix transcriptional regulator [Amycolatopsis sp. DSM 110486]
MDNRSDVQEFLTSRRARITPEKVGLPTLGQRRRVPGLRRAEVAQLAGVSVEYYTRLERGNLSGVSESVLTSLAAALRLNEAERAHLLDLARAASSGQTQPCHRSSHTNVRPSIHRILDGMTGVAGYVRNTRMDILAANRLCQALYVDIITPRTLPLNLARFLFFDPRAIDFYTDWDNVASDTVAAMHTEAGRNPLDRGLSALIGELATRSDPFRSRWARHNVRGCRTGTKRIHHPLVGDIELTCDSLDLPSDSLALVTYTAPLDSPAQEQLDFLAKGPASDHP